MSLTPAQLLTLKNSILADPILSALPMTNLASVEIRDAYNTVSNVDVWQTSAPVEAILNALDMTRYTPTDVPAIGDSPALSMLQLNRAQQLMIKQAILGTILQGRETLDMTRITVRAGLRDAVTGLPAGANGAAVSAGGAGGITALSAGMRKANRFEALYAIVDSTTGPATAKLLVLEGNVSSDEIQEARNIP
jgi:hypothetical protein